MMTACAARFDPAVEAALLEVYGIDVLDPRVTPRRIVLLMKRLPPGTFREADHPAAWTVESYMLANVVDMVRELTWVTLSAHARKGARPKRPKPFPRPGPRTKPTPKMRLGDLHRHLTGRPDVEVREV